MGVLKISMRGFAEVAAAESSRKNSKLKKFKFPDSEESIGRSNYYVKAVSAIKRHHKGQSDIVKSILRGLMAEAESETDSRKRAKLLNNHRAITDYLKNFGTRNLVIKSGKHLYYVYKDLIVSAHPDLVAQENGRTVLIKLNFCKDDFAGGVCAQMLHLLYEAAQLKGVPLDTVDVECIQTSSGSRVRGPKNGFPDKQVLNTACEELLTLWPAA
jgi:hypothetical protein